MPAKTKPIVVCIALLGGVAACSDIANQHARLDVLRRSIAMVTQAGAYGCAPRELALARAHYEFALIEQMQGDPLRAGEHLTEAEANLGAAQVRSPKERCERSAAPAPDLSANALPDRDGDRIPDQADRCPDEAEDWDSNLDADGCSDPDDDSDGVLDAQDACPTLAEDLDDHQDGDGCPDTDNDADGIQDDKDTCPDLPGPIERGGCARSDYPYLTVTERELRLATPIAFEDSTATIRSVALAVLDSVAQVLLEQPRMTLEIGGHTDSQGDDAENLALSQRQADAVREQLVARGVNASRLTARGYGETRPIESNSTSQGRAINRRIELVRTNRAP